MSEKVLCEHGKNHRWQCCPEHDTHKETGPEHSHSRECPEWDRCPRCGEPIRGKELWEGGGVECSAKCGYWFCY